MSSFIYTLRFSLERDELEAFDVAIVLTGWRCNWKKQKQKNGYYITVELPTGITTGQIIEFGRMLQNLVTAAADKD